MAAVTTKTTIATATSPLLARSALVAAGSQIGINGSGSGSGSVRYASSKVRPRPTPKPKPSKTKKMPPAGHGNRIYVFNHIMANHIVYSFYPKINVRIPAIF